MKYLFSLLVFCFVHISNAQSKISSELKNHMNLHSSELIPVRIEFKDNIDCRAMTMHFKTIGSTLSDRVKAINKILPEQAYDSQKDIIAFFIKNNISSTNYRSFWIVNLLIAKLDKTTINKLDQFSSISGIYLEKNQFIAHDTIIKSEISNKQPNGVENGLIAINAPPMWALGYTGRGRMVYNYDTGVWPTHPAFKDRFIGNHFPMSQSWIGYFNLYPNGIINHHGTHTLGTIAGLQESTNDTIGVAFGAYWIANDFVTETVQQLPPIVNMIEAFEWALNPDNDINTTYDVPDVINNSWRWYDDPDTVHCGGFIVNLMNAIEAAGIANVFSGGNFGPNNSTISSPQRINTTEVNTFTVGSVNGNLAFPYPISSFSSIGPTQCPGSGSLSIHPEVVAPGHYVRSAWGSDSYNSISGTSMAAPHVSGAVLLLKEAFPLLSGEELLWALYLTAQDLGAPGEDNVYGMGIIDVYAAFQYLSQSNTPTDPQGSITDLNLESIDILNINEITCDNSFSPQIVIQNKGSFSIDTIDFITYINGSVVQNYTWSGNLSSQQSANLTLPTISITDVGNIELNVKAQIRNGQTEYDVFNNSIIQRFNKKDLHTLPFVEHFENGIEDNLWYIQNLDHSITWDTTLTNGLVWNSYSAVIKLFSYAPNENQKDGLITPQIELGNLNSNYTLKFDLAYQKRSVSNWLKDTLRIYASVNCATSFDFLLYEKYDSDLSTLDTIKYNFVPEYSSHWRTDSVDLSMFSGENILLKFESTNRQGNNLYLDNVMIYEGGNQPLNRSDLNLNLRIYPNPAKNLLYIGLDHSVLDNAEILILNSLGKIIIQRNTSGTQAVIKLNNMNKGIYFIRLKNQNKVYTKSFVKW